MEGGTSKLGFFGIAVGATALLLVLVHFWAGPFSRQPTLESTVAERAVAIRDATVAALKGEDATDYAPPPEMNLDKALDVTGAVLGGLAVILGVLGFATKESGRVAGGAAVLGAGAIAFQFAAMAVGMIVAAIIVAAVISSLGLS
jgi:hypothetical protein